MNNTILYIVAFYIGYLLLWLFLNLVVFASSVVIRKNFTIAMVGLIQVVGFILSVGIILGLGYYFISLITHSQILLVVLLILVGGFIFSIITSVFDLVMLPFKVIPIYFNQIAVKQLKSTEQDLEADVIAPDGHVVGHFKSDARLTKELSFYFMLTYLLYLVMNVMTKRNQYENWAVTDYLWNPLSEIFIWYIPAAILVGIYNVITKRKFFYNGFKGISIGVFKLMSSLMGGVLAFFFIRYVIF